MLNIRLAPLLLGWLPFGKSWIHHWVAQTDNHLWFILHQINFSFVPEFAPGIPCWAIIDEWLVLSALIREVRIIHCYTVDNLSARITSDTDGIEHRSISNYNPHYSLLQAILSRYITLVRHDNYNAIRASYGWFNPSWRNVYFIQNVIIRQS